MLGARYHARADSHTHKWAYRIASSSLFASLLHTTTTTIIRSSSPAAVSTIATESGAEATDDESVKQGNFRGPKRRQGLESEGKCHKSVKKMLKWLIYDTGLA